VAGIYPVDVRVDGWGRAQIDDAVTFRTRMVIDSITPVTGSLKGGTVVVIEGKGFAHFGPYNKIEIGGVRCIPKTLKNLECRKDAVSMGYRCTKPITSAFDPLHLRQEGEWYDFSSSTRIECRMEAPTRRTAVESAVDVVVTLIDPALVATDEHKDNAVLQATRGSVLERLTGGCEQLANCKVLGEDYNRFDTLHSCQSVEKCALIKLYPVNPDLQRLCDSVDLTPASFVTCAAVTLDGNAATCTGAGDCDYTAEACVSSDGTDPNCASVTLDGTEEADLAACTGVGATCAYTAEACVATTTDNDRAANKEACESAGRTDEALGPCYYIDGQNEAVHGDDADGKNACERQMEVPFSWDPPEPGWNDEPCESILRASQLSLC